MSLFFLALLLLLSLVVLFFTVSSLWTFVRTNVPPVQSAARVADVVAEALGNLRGKTFVDLGCGDGRLLVAICQKTGARGIGFELSRWPFFKASLHAKQSMLPITIRRKNFLKASLSEADAVFCYLFDTAMPRVEQKLQRELKPGATVISYAFPFPNWKPERVIPRPDPKRSGDLFAYGGDA